MGKEVREYRRERNGGKRGERGSMFGVFCHQSFATHIHIHIAMLQHNEDL